MQSNPVSTQQLGAFLEGLDSLCDGGLGSEPIVNIKVAPDKVTSGVIVAAGCVSKPQCSYAGGACVSEHVHGGDLGHYGIADNIILPPEETQIFLLGRWYVEAVIHRLHIRTEGHFITRSVKQHIHEH